MACQLQLFAEAWADLMRRIDTSAEPYAVQAVLTAHDDTCVECHNTDQRPRCPLRLGLVKAMTQLAGAK